MKQTNSKEPREVNTLLHTLRGEQFRHSQNVKQSRTHLATFGGYNRQTLPSRFATLESDASLSTTYPARSPSTTYSGPAPPKSWRSSPERDSNSQENVQWRARALKLIASDMGNFMDIQHVPSLALLCLRMIFSRYITSTEFKEDIVPYMPYHLRRDAIRYCAVHFPLPNWKLSALFNPQGNADGEILIMGPTASLPENHFIRGRNFIEEEEFPTQSTVPADRNWESEDPSEEPLLSLILVSTRLSTSTMFSLPPTITRLALINLSTPIPVHRLPKLCPLIVLLDLSYNNWLKTPASEGFKSLERTPWTRWRDMVLLGLRECHISDDLVRKINTGRWDDIHIIKE
ncbi:hypothetical protein BDN70DRAFT_849414 [Pholiota conissans]|uniref:Uncharacterized protein n=1 Tax=Pholiota conissans TaxID=109636 RepID=A0A9P5ZAP6_9AGAR|nr:hypothetical protein BDN70DRAFT_849414 [Pholiota conissans]